MAGENADTVRMRAGQVARAVAASIRKSSPRSQLMGPAPAPLPILGGRHRFHLVLKSPDSKSVAQQLKWVDELPEMYSEFFSDPSLPAEIKVLERESLVAMERLCAQLLWRNHRRRQWFGCVGRAFWAKSKAVWFAVHCRWRAIQGPRSAAPSR